MAKRRLKLDRKSLTAKRPAELEYTPTNCHAKEMLARIGDKWSVYVIHVLGDAGTLRFNELRGQVDGISQRMLTVTLRGMERDGLVTRRVYPEVPRAWSTRSRRWARRCASWCAAWWSGRARISPRWMPRGRSTTRDTAASSGRWERNRSAELLTCLGSGWAFPDRSHGHPRPSGRVGTDSRAWVRAGAKE